MSTQDSFFVIEHATSQVWIPRSAVIYVSARPDFGRPAVIVGLAHGHVVTVPFGGDDGEAERNAVVNSLTAWLKKDPPGWEE